MIHRTLILRTLVLRTLVQRTLARSVFCAGLVLSSAVLADPAIVKCIDGDGKVTLTDSRCPAAAQTVAVVTGGDMAAGADSVADGGAVAAGADGDGDVPDPGAMIIAAPASERAHAPAWNKPELPGVRKYAGGALARDVATLKAARHSLMLQDSAAQAARSQRLAGLQ
jgi:hypothetical protein